MGNSIYTTLTRQTGLLYEMQAVANNIANISTTGFRKEGVVFSEFISAPPGSSRSLSMARVNARSTDLQQGSLTQTNGTFDFAIEGEGFFLLETPAGERLTRAGNFTPNADSELVATDGSRLLDAGGAPIFIPPNAKSVGVAADGTLSVDGRPLSRIGVFKPANPFELARETSVRFSAASGFEPIEDTAILQGFLEDSNVNPVSEVARMIEIQRAYELGQSFLEKEDERIRAVLQTLGQ